MRITFWVLFLKKYKMYKISSFATLYIDKSVYENLDNTTQVVQFTFMDDVYEVSWDYTHERVIIYDSNATYNVYFTVIHPDIPQTSVTLNHILTAMGFGDDYVIEIDMPVGVITNRDNYLDTPIYHLPLSQFTLYY